MNLMGASSGAYSYTSWQFSMRVYAKVETWCLRVTARWLRIRPFHIASGVSLSPLFESRVRTEERLDMRRFLAQ